MLKALLLVLVGTLTFSVALIAVPLADLFRALAWYLRERAIAVFYARKKEYELYEKKWKPINKNVN
jgi:hypothetical protein